MEELTKTQEQELRIIIGYINYAKQFNSVEEMYKSLNLVCKWENLTNEEQLEYIDDYNNRLNNIARKFTNSNTIRALEKKGYIEIIKDGKNKFDIVKLLKVI